MSEHLTRAFETYLAGEGRPAYGVDASSAPGDRRIALTLTFKAGVRYCCAEPGCHLWLFDAAHWERLHRCMADEGLVPSRPLTVHVHGVVERDAMLETLGHLALPESSKSYEYDAVFIEPPVKSRPEG